MNFSLMDKETKHQLQMERQLEEEHLMEFLYTQKRLETLRLSFDYRTTKLFPKNDSTLYQFKLKELSLSCQCKKENLKAFLYTQDSVEKLELRCIYLNIALELCLNKFENFKTLCIGEKSFPADFKTLKVNKSVTKLILRRINGDHVKYCKFVSLFPNVTDIIFPSETPFEVLFCLPNLCKALTSLSLHTLLPGNYQNLKFFALKFFHLQKFEGGNNWSDFVLSNPTIETLSFEYSDADDDEQYIDADKIKMVCEALPNLKYLNFGGNMKKKYYLLQNMRKKIQITMIKHGFY